MTTDEEYLLIAKQVGEVSLCKRRKIGVVLFYPFSREISTGVNGFKELTCDSCTRTIECPAIHAEVEAILNMQTFARLATKLYIWAEVPCLNCLSFISHQTSVRDIYCLHPSLYYQYYERVKDYHENLTLRRNYAKKLGITLHELKSLNSNFE